MPIGSASEIRLQVPYTTALDDYVAFNRHVFRKSRTMWVAFVLGWLLIPIIALAIAVGLVLSPDLWLFGLCAAAFGLLYGAIYPPIYYWWLDWFIRSFARQLGTRGMLGQITLILTDESLTEITETTRSEVRWENVHGVDVVGDYTFIFITGISAAILPVHGFAVRNDYEAVRELAISRVGIGRVKRCT